MQFMITAFDGKDDGAPARRQAARSEHLQRVGEARKAGHLIAGGAILDDDENMIGSTIYMDFETRAELDAWIAADPYVRGDVWQDIDIRPIRLAVRL